MATSNFSWDQYKISDIRDEKPCLFLVTFPRSSHARGTSGYSQKATYLSAKRIRFADVRIETLGSLVIAPLRALSYESK